MGKPMSPLQNLGRFLRQTQDEALEDTSDLVVARRRFLASKKVRTNRGRWMGAVAVAATAVLAVTVLWRSHEVQNLSVEVENAKGAVFPMQITVPTNQDRSLRFSDGTTVLLRENTRTHLTETTPHGAHLTIERGHAAVSVVRKEGAQWRFDVGPFLVRVVGTRFDTGWDPNQQFFELVLHDGSVVVEGPTISGARSVVAGQELRISLAREVVSEVREAGRGQDPSPVPAGSASAPNRSPVDLPSAPASSPPEVSWQSLARGGKYREAVEVADKEGVDSILAGAPVGDVMALGDCARLAGRVALARRAYLMIRQRGAGTPQAALAAFHLGRFAFPSAASVPWFERYMTESPNGSLAREALGRAMEAHHRSGNRQAAKTWATRYLSRYPGGPHSTLARKLLEE